MGQKKKVFWTLYFVQICIEHLRANSATLSSQVYYGCGKMTQSQKFQSVPVILKCMKTIETTSSGFTTSVS